MANCRRPRFALQSDRGVSVTSFAIDLGRPLFWLVLLGAALLLAPIAQPEVRRSALTVVNLTFIACLAGAKGAVGVLVFVLVIRTSAAVASRATTSGALRALALTGAALVVAGLFVLHKLGLQDATAMPGSASGQILVAVGFSYVALRSVELLRAGAERRVGSLRWRDAVNYLFPFHMLAAGPIQSWSDFATAPVVPARIGRDGMLEAIERIVHGLFKKFVLARAIEVVFLTGFRASAPYALLEVQAYCLWIYLDFSAYSDIAVGAGRLLGVETPENFRNPFASRNIVEFWSRWHITLSSFVRRNIFIPLQLTTMRRLGVSHALLATSVAFAAAFLFVGLWHALTLRFAIWGALHAFALILCTVYGQLLLKRLGRKGVSRYESHRVYRALSTLMTFEFVALSLAFIAHPAPTPLK